MQKLKNPHKKNFVLKVFLISNFLNKFRTTKFLSYPIYFFLRIVFNCIIPPNTSISKDVHLGLNGFGCIFNSLCVIDENVYLGANILIGGNAKEHGAPHIKKNCIIFSNSTILGPIVIGEGCVIAAGSLVIHNIPEKTLVAGNPAKIIKKNINVLDYIPIQK